MNNIQAPTLDASDFLSIGDRLGGKRIDNAIERARSSSIPLQGAQSGGYAPAFAHLSHIPLFPLYHDVQTRQLEKTQYRKEQQLKYVKPPVQQGKGEKLLWTVSSALGGGANPASIMKWENRLGGVGAVQKQKSMEQTHALVFTRWALPHPQDGIVKEIWFLDVLEWRAKIGAAVYVKVGKEGVNFRAVGKTVEKCKVGKTWTKSFLSGEKGRCDAVSWVGEARGKGVEREEVEMVIVARIERPCAPIEGRPSLKTFEKEWVVPVVAMG